MEKRKRKGTIIKDNYSKKCSAKINLFLEVIAKRTDGFHELRSLFGELSLADDILFKLTENPQVKISCTSNHIPNGENLVLKIVRYLKKTYRIEKGLEIILKKNIPISAGLGGGSSDAAQTILACNELWKLDFSYEKMNKIALKFGSDISYFLQGGTSCVFGRGEIVKPISNRFEIKNILLVNPNIHISSRDAYSWMDIKKEKTDKFKKITQAFLDKDFNMLSENLFNSLEPGVFAHYPVIEKIKNKLIKFGATGSLMSGSGSTVFGIFDSIPKINMAKSYFNNLKYWTKISSLQT
ncbi:MAG: 4-(cytidine 5'-diphospho)-2-C-methyl-D-erythritol kinase [Candidatus Cloacimonadota bacterium]|nr:4-(cytidine 5'-diphospho)-2-C-methyl-D-erythritol kinase [Candidatus Cloacimonadota bacterium]